MKINQYHLNAAGVTHVGMERKQNQDSFLAHSALGLFVVADGMGGHRGGEVASKLAVEAIGSYFAQRTEDGEQAKALIHGIEAANAEIQKRARVDMGLYGMGTTMTALFFGEREVYVGHVGDSRCYFISVPDRIWQITRDHSFVQERVRAGIITRDEAKTDRMRNVITRSVGFEAQVLADLYRMTFRCGDVFVLCSDGVSNMLSDREMGGLVSDELSGGGTAEDAARALIDASNSLGAEDNVTAIVVQVAEG